MLDDGDAAGEPGRDFAAQHLGAGPHRLDLGEQHAERETEKRREAPDAGRAATAQERSGPPPPSPKPTTVATVRLAVGREIGRARRLPAAPARTGTRCHAPIRWRPRGEIPAGAWPLKGRAAWARRREACHGVPPSRRQTPRPEPAAPEIPPAAALRGRARTERARRAASQAETCRNRDGGPDR